MIQKLFTTAVKPFVGSGLGRIKPLANIYQKLSSKIMPQEKIMDVQGFKIKVITQGHINDISTELIYKGVHEPVSTQIFKRLLQQGNCVVDIGANVGYFTLLSARLVGAIGRVYAFEPDVNNVQELQNNIALNPFSNVKVFQVALSDYNGRSKLFTSSMECARHSLIESKEHDGSELVDVYKLDDLIPKTIPVHFLKSDTEGNELAVLRGATETINRNDRIKLLIEVNGEALKLQNVQVVDLYNYLTVNLYMKYLYLVDDYKDNIFKVSLLQLMKYGEKSRLACNLLCSRDKLAI